MELERRRLPAFAQLVANYGGFLAENSDVGSPYSGLFSLLHLTQRAGNCPQIVLTAQYYARLRQAKGMWDPGNVFNHQQSIELP